MSYRKRPVKLRTMVGDDAAVAHLLINGRDFMGNSKRHPGDEFNYAVGESLAIARALRDAAEWYERRATSITAEPIVWQFPGWERVQVTPTVTP